MDKEDKKLRNLRAGVNELALLNMWRFLHMIQEAAPEKTFYSLYIFSDATGRLEGIRPGVGWQKVFFFNDFGEAIDKMSSHLEELESRNV